jgi:hypothetical protein
VGCGSGVPSRIWILLMIIFEMYYEDINKLEQLRLIRQYKKTVKPKAS